MASFKTYSITKKWVNPKYTPFYIEDVSGSDNTLSIVKLGGDTKSLTIQKSTDGKTWASMGNTSSTAITATVPANGRLYLRCQTDAWGINNSQDYFNKMSCSGNFNVGGNTMSLLYGSNFTGEETTLPVVSSMWRSLRGIFYGANKLISAEDLLLPATTLTNYCYQQMFYNCTSLTTVPSNLLPATTLTSNCYNSMFSGCTSLTTAPTLPATTLANNCYQSMFSSCSSLTTAPALNATTLIERCYMNMFAGCSSLSSITCLATNISASACTQNWLNNVSATGTFYKDPNMSSWDRGTSGIPSGWTVQNYQG